MQVVQNPAFDTSLKEAFLERLSLLYSLVCVSPEPLQRVNLSCARIQRWPISGVSNSWSFSNSSLHLFPTSRVRGGPIKLQDKKLASLT